MYYTTSSHRTIIQPIPISLTLCIYNFSHNNNSVQTHFTHTFHLYLLLVEQLFSQNPFPHIEVNKTIPYTYGLCLERQHDLKRY